MERGDHPFAGLLLPAEAVGWPRGRDPDLVAIWGEGDDGDAAAGAPDAQYLPGDERPDVYGERPDVASVRRRHFRTARQVSDPRHLDGECFLLDPQVVTPGGEWEAWFFAHWRPGARRYPSFWELMRGEHAAFLRLRHGP